MGSTCRELVSSWEAPALPSDLCATVSPCGCSTNTGQNKKNPRRGGPCTFLPHHRKKKKTTADFNPSAAEIKKQPLPGTLWHMLTYPPALKYPQGSVPRKKKNKELRAAESSQLTASGWGVPSVLNWFFQKCLNDEKKKSHGNGEETWRACGVTLNYKSRLWSSDQRDSSRDGLFKAVDSERKVFNVRYKVRVHWGLLQTCSVVFWVESRHKIKYRFVKVLQHPYLFWTTQ